MLNKNLIQEKFSQSIDFYDENAIIQELMAKKLVSLLPFKKYNNILEIGSYSGVLTKKVIEKFKFDSYLALDIVDSFDKISALSDKIKFQKIDVEDFASDEKFDLIIANASLQWCNDFRATIEKLKSYLAPEGVLAITTFADDNFFEIKKTFNVGLNYKTISELERIFSNAKILQEIHTLQFKSPNELLKHLKLTGVNAITDKHYGVIEMKKALQKLQSDFQNKLTYKPVYIIYTPEQLRCTSIV